MALRALIVDPNLSTRTLFREMAASLGIFQSTAAVTTLGEANQRMHEAWPADALYVSARFDLPVVEGFLDSVRNTTAGEGSAYLLLAQPGSVPVDVLAAYLRAGMDGVLLEPLSPDGLTDSVALATRVTGERKTHQQVGMIKRLVEESLTILDEIWIAKEMNEPIARHERRLEKIKQTVSKCDSVNQALYFEELASRSADRKPPSLPKPSHKEARKTVMGRTITR